MEKEYIDAEWREAGPDEPDAVIEALPSDGVLPAGGITYEGMVGRIEENIQSAKESFMSIGYCLKTIKEHELYRQDRENSYNNIYEFADRKFGISKSAASRLIRMCEEFSEGQNSPRLAGPYAGFSYSQLSEMIPMKAEDRERISPEMTVTRIREEKTFIREMERETREEKRREKDASEISTVLPKLKNREERKAWLENVQEWEGAPWYKDKNIGAVYYKADFPDGCRLIAARYENLLPDAAEGSGGAEDDGYGKPHYHMLYSDWHLLGCTEEEYEKKRADNFMDAETTVPELLRYLSERMTGSVPDQRLVEFDTGHLEAAEDKTLPYLTQKYIEFYRKKGYIPKYFSARNCTGDPDIAPTLTTSSGSHTGTGAIAIFRLDENLARIEEDRKANPGMREAEAKKLRQIAKAPENGHARDVGRVKFHVRRLTPEQAFALMGISAEHVKNCRELGISDAKLFRIAGNGIVPQVVAAGFGQLKGAVDHPLFSPDENPHDADTPTV